MPKKMGMNSKAVEAKERKQAVKVQNKEKAAKEAEDRFWQDDDKNLAKKKAKKEEEERKKQEVARKKAEAKLLLEEEMASIKVQGKQSVQKITRQQIQDEVDKRNRTIEQMKEAKNPSKIIVETETPLEENLNRVMANTDIATNVDEAIAVLSVNDGDDKHPEKRMRAAFKAFENANLPRIKTENPSLRMSQWKQILTKEWNKSPENPFNQHN